MSKKKKPNLENLIQQYLNAKDQTKKNLLAIIKRLKPDFKEPK